MALNGVAEGDVLRAVLEWSMPDAVTAQTVLDWYRSDSVGGLIPFVTMRGYLATKITDMVEALDVSLADVVTAELFKLYGMIWVTDHWEIQVLMGESTIDTAGLGTGDMAPHGVCALVSYPTIYPRVRGKTYLPGFGDTAFTGSTITAGSKQDAADWATEYLTTLAPGGGYTFVPVVLSSKYSTPVLLTQAVVSDYAAYQRRRGPGRGS